MKTVVIFSDKKENAAELVTLARSLGESCIAFVCGCEDAAAFENIGADKVMYLGAALPCSYAKAAAQLMQEIDAQLLITTTTAAGREFGALVSAYLDCPMSSDIVSAKIESDELIVERMVYGGAIIAAEAISGVGVISVGPGKAKASEGVCPIVNVSAAADGKVSVISESPIVRTGADISAAERVVGAGMGFTTAEELQTAYDLAQAIGGEVGCSRALSEDHHWFSQYIGLSGVQISPKLYFALGISGQIQHSVGVRGSQIIVAINRDENCPMMQGCDYGIVGDMYKLVPMLISELKA